MSLQNEANTRAKFMLSQGPVHLEYQHSCSPESGALVSFDGLVRNNNEGKDVLRLEYSAYAELALHEGSLIVKEAVDCFALQAALCSHALGVLEIGQLAVSIRVWASHRGEGFEACRWIIDQVKSRVPIWKKESYTDGTCEWVLCQHVGHHGH